MRDNVNYPVIHKAYQFAVWYLKKIETLPIDHEILKSMIAKKIECQKMLSLLCKVIDSSNPQEKVEHYFAGDDLFTMNERRIGLPLGNLTSQYLANIYLGRADHYAKEILRLKGYIRYVDDIVIFGTHRTTIVRSK